MSNEEKGKKDVNLLKEFTLAIGYYCVGFVIFNSGLRPHVRPPWVVSLYLGRLEQGKREKRSVPLTKC